MTPPTPAEQIARFVERHPGEWREVPSENPDEILFVLEVYPYRIKLEAYLSAVWGSLEHVDYNDTPTLDPCPQDASLLTQIAWRGADAIQAHGGSADTLPPWLADPVRHQLINRARVLLTSAGVSPADAVMAAETLDEALCQRAPVAATFSAVLAALQAIGMSCRWIVGADIPELDYIRGLELNLKATCRQCDDLLAAIKQAVADLDAYSETDKGVRIATLPARANLRRVLGVT